MITKKAKISYIRSKLASDAKWALRGLDYIFSKQTAQEKIVENTHEKNFVGFSGAHAEIMSSFAKQRASGRNLSLKQMMIVFKIMPKYWKQVMDACSDEKLIQCMLKDQAITPVDFMEAKL